MNTSVKAMPLKQLLRFVRLIMVGILMLGSIAPLPSAVSAQPASAPAPTVTGVSPNEGYNYQPTTITITGSDLVATPAAHLNNVPLINVTFVDSATLTATVPADLPGGAYTLTMTNPDSQSASLAGAFTVLAGGDGNLGTWQSMSSMNDHRRAHSAVVSGTYLYALGGYDNSAHLNSVERATINADGSLGPWEITAAMTKARHSFAAVVAGNSLYVMGGQVAEGGNPSAVERAIIDADGSLGLWETMPSLNTQRYGLAAIAVGRYIYVLGGGDCSTSAVVERATVNLDGSLGSWQVVSFTDTGRYLPAIASAGGYIYVIGGQNADCGGSGLLSSVERAVVNADGSLGEWQATSPMTTARGESAAAAVGGYLYALGGEGLLSSVERAPINADGSLGTWSATTSMRVPRTDHEVVAVGKYIYALGGRTAVTVVDPPFLETVERAMINPLSLVSLLPMAVTSDYSTTITINGANFLPIPSARLNESTGLVANFISTNTMTATVPAGLPSGWYTATLLSIDGRVATLVNALRVDGPGPVMVGDLGFTVNDGAMFTNQVTVTLTIASHPDTASIQVSNDGGFAGAQWETYTSHKPWQITQYGSYVLPRVVYVRYKDLNANVSATSQDDIILDVTAPTGSVEVIPSASSLQTTGMKTVAVETIEAQSDPTIRVNDSYSYTVYLPFVRKDSTGPANVTLRLNAQDDVSGVAAMIISNAANFDFARWESYTMTKAWYVPQGTTTIYVKFRDNAGNVSEIVSDSITMP